jgi:mono/diheme cytochrome c family protein
MVLFCLAAFAGCNYQRMRDQESVRTYKKEMPEMDGRTIPVSDGFQTLLTADPDSLQNPVPPTKESVERGKQAYGYYCVQCHGVRFDGMGTVGQSFSPLPANLRTDHVQMHSDGNLYAKIRLGHRRHPRLYTTMSEGDTWAVVDFIKTLNRG